MEEKRFRKKVTIINYLKANNAKEHFLCIDKSEQELHVVITRNGVLEIYSIHCQLGGQGEWGGLKLEEMQKVLAFINK